MRSKSYTRQSHLDLYKVHNEGSVGGATVTSLGDTTTANMLLNILALSQQQENGLSIRERFIPNQTMFLQDSVPLPASGDRSLTISHFGVKNRSSLSPKLQTKTTNRGVSEKWQQSANVMAINYPTFPNRKARGLIKGSKIVMK